VKHRCLLSFNVTALALSLLLVSHSAIASDSEHAVQAPAADTFAATSHRRFDDVEHWKSVFDDPERAKWQKPDELVRTLALRDGDRVADLGAGTGYLLSRLSKAVGANGTVYAVEVETNLIEHMRARAETEDLANVIPVLTSMAIPRLPVGGVDLVLILDTYHHLDERNRYIARLNAVLAEGGRIAIIDWKKEKLPVGPPPDHKLTRQQVIDEMTNSGFRLTEESTALEYQYFLIFAQAS
jgi:ubiquinone/menaquinone biosynthesis C-methylase UbiE